VVAPPDTVPPVALLRESRLGPVCPGSTMMLGVGPKPAVSLREPPGPQFGRDPEAAPCCVLGVGVPPTSPAGPGAIGVPPGPTRCAGTADPAGPGATGTPPGPTCPLFKVVPAAPVPLELPGATGAGAVALPAAPPPGEPAEPVPPPLEPVPPLVCAATMVLVARTRALAAATIFDLFST
jgi:hypothetical protein